ncbi:MAG TPA: hypothetical protein VH186_13810 [Chloroflexia bacterium]|nr:hypothetical protein [Chloroflexia bacterium]
MQQDASSSQDSYFSEKTGQQISNQKAAAKSEKPDKLDKALSQEKAKDSQRENNFDSPIAIFPEKSNDNLPAEKRAEYEVVHSDESAPAYYDETYREPDESLLEGQLKPDTQAERVFRQGQ